MDELLCGDTGTYAGARVFFPEWRWYPVDVFANCEKTHRVAAPVLIMHGLNDEIIDINQAMALHRALAHVSVMPLFIAGTRIIVDHLLL